MRLEPGESVPWHSTGAREEVLIVLEGSLRLEYRRGRGAPRAMRLSSGFSAFLPQSVPHRVVNRSRRRLGYLYLTA